MHRIVLVGALILLCLPGCGAKIYIVRVPTAVKGGQEGDAQPDVLLKPCNTLQPDNASACVLVAKECQYGLHTVRFKKVSGGYEARATCLAPTATDPGDSPL